MEPTFQELLEAQAGVCLGAMTVEQQERVWAKAVKARELRQGIEPVATPARNKALAEFISSCTASLVIQATREAMDGGN